MSPESRQRPRTGSNAAFHCIAWACLLCACGSSDIYLGSELEARGAANTSSAGSSSTAGTGGTAESDGAAGPGRSSAGTSSFPGNTGMPGTSGQGGTSAADAGAAEPDGCPTGMGDCDGDSSNGCETDLQTTVESCGTCNVACPWIPETIGSLCEAGKCVPVCELMHENCDGSWVNGCEAHLLLDSNNCGSCGTVCPCSGGACR